MTYLPTVDLTSNATMTALHLGHLKLQTGQWVNLGNSKPSRFVRVTRTKSIHAVHPNGGKVTNERFLFAVNNWPK